MNELRKDRLTRIREQGGRPVQITSNERDGENSRNGKFMHVSAPGGCAEKV
jgi:hypothetical protein